MSKRKLNSTSDQVLKKSNPPNKFHDSWWNLVNKFEFYNADSNSNWTLTAEEAIKQRCTIWNNYKESSHLVTWSNFPEQVNDLVNKYCSQEEKKKILNFKKSEKTPSWNQNQKFL